MIVGLTGCRGEADNGVDEKSEAEEAISETISKQKALYEPEFEITTWTMKDFVTDMEISGMDISLPCTVSEFENVFKIDYYTYLVSDDITNCMLSLDGEHVGSLWVSGKVENKSALGSLNVYMFELNSNERDLVDFDIMGITNRSSKDDVLEILGKPNIPPGEKLIRYTFSEDEVVMMFFDEMSIIELILIFYNLGS